MADAVPTDEAEYANESFENDTDTEAVVNYDTDTTDSVSEEEEEDDDEMEVPPNALVDIKAQHTTFARSRYNDAVDYASSSDDDNDVVITQTIAEINTQPMRLEDAITPTSSNTQNNSLATLLKWGQRQSITVVKETLTLDMQMCGKAVALDAQADNDNVAEDAEEEDEVVEDDDDEPTERLQTAIAKVSATSTSDTDSESSAEFKSPSEDDDVTALTCAALTASRPLENIPEQTDESKLSNTNISVKSAESLKSLKSAGEEETPKAVALIETSASQPSINTQLLVPAACVPQSNGTETEGSEYNGTYRSQSEVLIRLPERQCIKYYSLTEATTTATEVETDNYDERCYEPHVEVCFRSQTPSSYNSDDYAFHMQLIKRSLTVTSEKSRLKAAQRKSWSFSNARVREIERHNQILLRKILTQKPTYTMKPSNSNTKFAPPFPPPGRVTTAAVNRKKQQRQIDLDNDILKRKIEAISLRRPIL